MSRGELFLKSDPIHTLLLQLSLITQPTHPPSPPSSLFQLQAASQRGGEEGAVTMELLYLPWSIRLPVTSSPQVVIRVGAAEMVEDQQQEEEEGLKQCEGLLL